MKTLKTLRTYEGSSCSAPPGIGKRALIMSITAAMCLGIVQTSAWAVCSDGGLLPAKGFTVNSNDPRVVDWSPGVYTATAGSFFIPDTSVNEFNDPLEPLTKGGHNWAFDQGSTTCKQTDTGPAGGVATAWSIPANNPTDCVVLPIIQGGVVKNLGDIPFQGDVITPTCDPTKLSTATTPNPLNTRLNQLGCAISGGVATDAQHATSYMFVAGIKGGLFSIPLDNANPPVVGGESGKTVGGFTYYSTIPEGQKLTNAAVSKDGMFAIATSIRRATYVYACLNPLGYPGEPSQPIPANFTVPQGSEVQCMQVGNNALAVDLTTAFGPDNQPYFGGQRVVNTFNNVPGGTETITKTAWPQCIYNGFGFPGGITPTTLQGRLQAVFAAKSANHCGNATANSAMTGALVTQPSSIISHGPYMYTGPLGGTVLQFKLGTDANGRTTYKSRQYATGLSLVTGFGVADDLTPPLAAGAVAPPAGTATGSLMMMTDPSAVGLAGAEVVWKVPMCEDM